jgi:TPR repeat protein
LVKVLDEAADHARAYEEYEDSWDEVVDEEIYGYAKKAVNCFEKAAAQGHPDAMKALGDCYTNAGLWGNVVDEDPGKAQELYRRAADLGNEDAEWKCIPGDPIEAMEWYRGKAEQGDPRAQYALGNTYEHGNGVPRDNAKAIEWYEKAAEQGYVKAQSRLGRCYEDGSLGVQDYEKAAAWYEKAVARGDTGCMYWLGTCYREGRGVPKNEAKARDLFRRAAGQEPYWETAAGAAELAAQAAGTKAAPAPETTRSARRVT